MPVPQRDLADLDEPCKLRPVDAAQEDDYWRRVFWCESYFRDGLDYEDYAPAYCAGYIGYAQYGGDYEDAETSLCANWVRIKGDSRLTIDEAMQAIRAAWDHAAEAQSAQEDVPAVSAAYAASAHTHRQAELATA
jgi:hypothetical protein